MSNEGLYWDSTPFIPMGGVTTATTGQTADLSIRADLYNPGTAATPEAQAKFRNTRHLKIMKI